MTAIVIVMLLLVGIGLLIFFQDRKDTCRVLRAYFELYDCAARSRDKKLLHEMIVAIEYWKNFHPRKLYNRTLETYKKQPTFGGRPTTWESIISKGALG